MAWVDGFRLELLEPNHSEYKWIKDKMHRTIASHNGNTIAYYDLIKIYRNKNSSLWDRYVARRDRIAAAVGGKVVEKRLFHGTNYADSIVKNGFDLKYADPNGMFGKGIYFTNLSSKSSQYTLEGCNTPCKMHGKVLCYLCPRKMLVCKVALGKQYEAQGPMNGIVQPPAKYHSVVAKPKPGFLNYPEYIIYNNHQAYPGFLIEYKIKF